MKRQGQECFGRAAFIESHVVLRVAFLVVGLHVITVTKCLGWVEFFLIYFFFSGLLVAFDMEL